MNTEESIKLLARLDERTKNLTERLEVFIEAQEKACTVRFEDHEKRIRLIERWQWKVTGIAAAAATGGTVCGSSVGVLVGLFFRGF